MTPHKHPGRRMRPRALAVLGAVPVALSACTTPPPDSPPSSATTLSRVVARTEGIGDGPAERPGPPPQRRPARVASIAALSGGNPDRARALHAAWTDLCWRPEADGSRARYWTPPSGSPIRLLALVLGGDWPTEYQCGRGAK